MSRGYVGIKNLERITQRLSEVIRTLSMETTDFDGCRGGPVTLKAGEKTEFIREETRLWRESWSLGPLRDIKKELKRFL